MFCFSLFLLFVAVFGLTTNDNQMAVVVQIVEEKRQLIVTDEQLRSLVYQQVAFFVSLDPILKAHIIFVSDLRHDDVLFMSSTDG